MKVILFILFTIIHWVSLSQISIEFNEPGSYNWTKPVGVDTLIIECWGSGGRGGGCYSVSVGSPCCWSGGGGGGGAYAKKTLLSDQVNNDSFELNVAGNNQLTLVENNGLSIVHAGSGSQGGSGSFLNFGTGGLGGVGGYCIDGCDEIIPGSNGEGGISTIGGTGGASYLGGLGGLGGMAAGNQETTLGIAEDGNSPGGGGGGRGINQNCIGISSTWPRAEGGNGLIKITLPEFQVLGQVFRDFDENCLVDSTEIGVDGIHYFVPEINYSGTTMNNGYIFIPKLSDGNYTVQIDIPPGHNGTCGQELNFTVNNSQSINVLFGLIDNNPCSDPNVSIFAPSLRRCFSNRIIYVSACNGSTATGILDSSFIDVELDSLLTLNDASLTYTTIGDNVFRFEAGDIFPGQCVNFTLSTTVSCDAQNGQTLCMDATLFPAEDCVFDSIPSDPVTNDGIGGTLDGLPGPCTLPWDKSSLSVEGWCQGDSVYFSVTNTGDFGDGDMECYSPVWLTVDGVVTDTDSLQIEGGETVIYSYPGTGQTFILNAEQHPLHPGNSHPNAHVELCGDSTNWTPGGVNQFPQDDADPDVDIYCGQVTAPVDPNDKTGYPLGQTAEYYIQPNQQLQYVIRFQNVGTDTAFNVVVKDTLDLDLNILSVTPGVASHPYTFKMYGPRVLEWTFEDIQLPDSTTNSEGSNGFLTFHVDQVPDLAPGTVINNDADIYFDFELPITTNTTVHKIFEGFVEVLNIEDLTIEGKEIFMYPNPTTNLITIQSESVLNNKFKIYDQQGREVMNGKLTGKNTEVSLGKLSRGTYTIQVDGNYKPAVIIKE